MIEDFTRELFLEACECTNSCFMLPPLTRDSFSKKGIFYKTEKIIVQNYGQSFPFSSSTKVRDSIMFAYDKLVQDHFSDALVTTI